MKRNSFRFPSLFLLLAAPFTASITARAQNVAIFPDEYAAVPEGPHNSPNLPFARGTSRVMCLYQSIDLQIPSGNQITRVGFRQDGNVSTVDSGVALQLEIRMGYSLEDEVSMSGTFDANYDGAATTVFGPALYTPPALRDPANPLPNGEFFIDLTTPFTYAPNGRNLIVEYRIFGAANGGQQFNYRLDRADYYSPTTNGPAGCMHSGGGTPVLAVVPTRPGLSFGANLSSGPANAPTFLAVLPGGGLVPSYPLDVVFPGVSPTCTGQMALNGTAIMTGVTNTGGALGFAFPIPNNPALADLPISSQAILLDFFSPGTVVVSNGAEVLTGANPRTAVLAANGVPSQVTVGSKLAFYCPVALFQHQ